MKKLHIESDIVLQSEQGGIRILTKKEGLTVYFEDWNTVSAFFNSAKGSVSSLNGLFSLTKSLDQRILIEVSNKTALSIHCGKIDQWKLSAVLRLIWLRIRSA